MSTCDECNACLDAEEPGVLHLSQIRFRKNLCAPHYVLAKSRADVADKKRWDAATKRRVEAAAR